MHQLATRLTHRFRKRIQVGKVDIAHFLTERYGYGRYLEIATPTTGMGFGKVDPGRFDACHRLLYRCPSDYSDGLPIDHRCPHDDISTALSAMATDHQTYDIVLIDGFHTYEAAARDMSTAFSLLDPGGALVIHDCLPPNEAAASPQHVPGTWCGVTYRAYLDFVLGRDDLRYLTVDSDRGCGVVRRVSATAAESRPPRDLITGWKQLGEDYGEMWRFFEPNRSELLRLTKPRALFAGHHHLG